MADHNYKFNISMSCGGCSGAIERVLKKLEGQQQLLRTIFIVRSCSNRLAPPRIILILTLLIKGVKSYNVSLDTQSADIVTEPSLEYSTVLEKIKKTGKKVNSGSADGESMDV